MVSTIAFIVSGLLIGAAFGYALQRGRFCVNSAFREVLFQDYTMLRAYLLAVAVTMIGANFIEDMGWIQHVDETGAMAPVALYRQGFAPFANIIGGFIFGMGIVLAGGCGSGILYRVGEGNLAYVMAVCGFIFGIVMTKFGFLKPVFDALTELSGVRWRGQCPDARQYHRRQQVDRYRGDHHTDHSTLCSRASRSRRRKRDIPGPSPDSSSGSLP